jgi:hypothetical protein
MIRNCNNCSNVKYGQGWCNCKNRMIRTQTNKCDNFKLKLWLRIINVSFVELFWRMVSRVKRVFGGY